MPLPRRVRGRVRVHPQGLCRFVAPLDAAGRHRWGPIAPCARIEVDLDRPGLRWRGHAYLDSNEGDEPVDRAFRELGLVARAAGRRQHRGDLRRARARLARRRADRG